MRLNEFTNAEEQLGLLRIIIDSTWSAVRQQAEMQKRQQAQQAASRKSKLKVAPKLKIPKQPQRLQVNKPAVVAQPIATPQPKPFNVSTPVKLPVNTAVSTRAPLPPAKPIANGANQSQL